MNRVLRSRLHPSYLSCSGGKLLHSSTAGPAAAAPLKEPIAPVAAEALQNDQAADASGSKKGWGFLKFMVLSVVTGALGAAGYATYAYTTEELDQRSRSLRSFANQTVADNNFQSLLYSTASVKALDVYLDIRKSIEDHVRGFTEPSSDKLLPDLHPQEQGVFTLVLDLNETLVYSDWTIFGWFLASSSTEVRPQ